MTVTQLDTLEALRDQRDVDFDEDQQARSLLLRKRHHVTHLIEDAGAAVVTAEHVMFRCPDHVTDGMQLLSVGVSVQTGWTGAGTNFKTLILQKRDDAGANPVALLTANRDTQVTIVANVIEAQTLTVTAADLVLAPGEVVTAEVTADGTGKALGKWSIHLVFEEL